MTRKDYALIADAINRAVTANPVEARWGIMRAAESIADALYIENGNFKHGRFMAAAGFADLYDEER